MRPRYFIHALVLPALVAGSASAQTGPRGDVELLGEVHGTRPPAAYYERLARNPTAFTFSRGWKARNPGLRRVDPPGAGGEPRFEPVRRREMRTLQGAAAVAPTAHAVTGTVHVPLLLGLFADSPTTPPFTRAGVQAEFFDGPNSRFGTITDYYTEISGGLIELAGETLEWQRSGLTESQVAGGSSGLGPGSRVGEFIVQVIQAHAGQVDWGLYDNDGPDGVPNSGDDDGFVDVLTVVHEGVGAECGGSDQDDRVWSHRWRISGWMGSSHATDVDAAGGGKIRIEDYTIQPVYSCSGGTINEIGVLAHELGHAFGLPDLYDTRSSSSAHNGIGGWGLMGSGSWGCSQGTPSRPCHMSAWSKAVLGWAEEVTLAPDTDLGTMTFDPVETGRTVYRVDAADGSGQYYLLENRQRIGYDGTLPSAGLLVWHVDPDAVFERWASNQVNADDRMGVFLVQADGDNDLGNDVNRGDAGDPFPGRSGRTEFHAASVPAARTWEGEPTGLTLTGIGSAGESGVAAEVRTRLTRVTLDVTGEPAEGVVFAVDGDPVGARSSFPVAPFDVVEILAGAGPEVEDGVRIGFEAWEDDPLLGRVRTLEVPLDDLTLTARYGGEEVRARLTLEGGEFGVEPGAVSVSPDVRREADGLWFPRGEEVTFQAMATSGFAFERWTGALQGTDNPASLTMSDPVSVGAAFTLVYAVEDATHAFEAARPQDIVLVAENAQRPVEWTQTGVMPRGLEFRETGRITGSALETGAFTLTVTARDANGLEATAEVTLDVAEPTIALPALAAPFINTSGTLTSAERRFLDAQGNDNGRYDLGDFRAWVLLHPDLPESVEERALVRALVPVIRFPPGGGR